MTICNKIKTSDYLYKIIIEAIFEANGERKSRKQNN